MLRNLDERKIYKLKSTDFTAETYMFNLKSNELTDDERKLFNLKDNSKGDRWIAKNPKACCGKGIKLLDNLEDF